MRRSRSSSSIPLAASLQNRRDSRNRERAKSVARRDPSLDNVTPLAHHRIRTSGMDKKYSLQKNYLSTTPVAFSGFKRTSSISSFGSRVSVTPGDKKNLHKKVNDKKWVAEQYMKVQEYIKYRGILNPELAGKIRPPTLAIFVELISTLFGEIIKTIPINLQNYIDVTMQTLKLLQYPGQLTPSTFKTVNTMHGWPHFISIISWLIDRADIQSIIEVIRDQQSEEGKVAMKMQDAVYEFLTKEFHTTISDEKVDEEYSKQSEEKLHTDMLTIVGVDYEAAMKINERVELEEAEVEKVQSELQEIEEENAKIKAQNEERQNVIDKYEENKGNREIEVKEEVLQLEKALIKHVQHKAALLESIKQLEDCISRQTCKLHEKNKILSQIEDHKRLIERKEQKISEYRVVRDDLDLDLKTLVTKIENKVDNWNISITKTFLPEIISFRLREKGFHSLGFLQEIKDIQKEKQELQEMLLNEYRKSQTELERIQTQKASLIESTETADSSRKIIDELKTSVKLLEEQNTKLVADIDLCKENHSSKITKLEEAEENKKKDQEGVLQDLINRNESIIEEIDKCAKVGLAVIVEAHNLAVQNIQKLDTLRVSMLNGAKMYLERSNQNLNESFNHLVSLQTTTAKLFQASDKENLLK